MCGPQVVVPLMIASTAVTAGGQIYSGMAARAQANYQAKVATANEQQAAQAAQQEQVKGQQDQIQLMRRIAETKGAQVSALAASGVDLTFGSARSIQEDTSQLGAEDVQALNQNIEQRTNNLLIDAANYRSQAAAARAQGQGALASSLIGAFGTALGGASQISGYRAQQRLFAQQGAVPVSSGFSSMTNFGSRVPYSTSFRQPGWGG
jgi:hypothetical protein